MQCKLVLEEKSDFFPPVAKQGWFTGRGFRG
jgi:hypothetical protein